MAIALSRLTTENWAEPLSLGGRGKRGGKRPQSSADPKAGPPQSGLGGAARSRRHRDRCRRGTRCYDVELSDVDLATLIDRGEISELDALDPVRVAIIATRLLKKAIKNIP